MPTSPVRSATPFVIANLLGYIVVLVVNYLANALPIGGRTPGEVSGMFPTLFTPAGYTFAIWGLIYLLLLGFVVYQARFWGKEAPAFLHRIGWLFLLSCAANAAWLPAFHYLQLGLSLLVILVLLGSLIGIYLRLDIGKSSPTPAEKWLVHLPFSVYLGWVSVATIANASILLTHLGWEGQPGGPQFWTVLVIAVAVGLGLAALLLRRDFGFALVIVWALSGIYSNRIANIGADDGLLEIATIAGMVLLGLGVIYRALRRG
jgi:tryptophan-rich sensory protein